MNFAKLLEPIKNRIRMILNRALVVMVNDGTPIQLLQISIMKDEVKSGVERLQDFGFTSNPKSGAETLVAFLNGNKDQGIIIKVDDSRYRKKNLDPGNSAMYNSEGVSIHLEGKKIKITGMDDVEIGNSLFVQELLNKSFQTAYNTHTHVCSSPGSPSATPLPISAPTELTSKLKAE